ncbi:LytTR family DNA-binding domain-containing protein [Marinigracilibium pacificum]|uniref:LytTR family transcriptional regulator n=1 Tax=Marinigracilibium pacificum TaxID=2729599 RepID=A0A848ISZ5_9BACT|nr:LytTR family DNA-binding domain-containing protein [Marinigracilibium pacificum]NMM47583.1 LytTR family transcriptional regulator [Marinigracilibium pacificum]
MTFRDIDFSLSTKGKVFAILGTGLYMILFLLFFQPFGVNNYDPSESISDELVLGVTIMVGAATLVILLVTQILYDRLILKYSGKGFIYWMLISLMVICTVTFLTYNWLGGWHDWRFSSYIEFIVNIGATLIIPFFVIFVFLYQRSLNASLELAYKYQGKTNNSLVTLKSDNGKETLSLNHDSILLIESEDNYVGIHCVEDGNVKKHLLRRTLKSIENERVSDTLIRCHRSYIINLAHLNQINGNRNKMIVKINNIDRPVPVSRKYIDEIYELAGK